MVPGRPQGYPPPLPEPEGDGSLPPAGSFLAVEGGVVVTALKRAEDSEALVVRVLNESAENTTARLHLLRRPLRARLLNLREEPLGEFEVGPDGEVSFPVQPWRLVTVDFEF